VATVQAVQSAQRGSDPGSEGERKGFVITKDMSCGTIKRIKEEGGKRHTGRGHGEKGNESTGLGIGTGKRGQAALEDACKARSVRIRIADPVGREDVTKRLMVNISAL